MTRLSLQQAELHKRIKQHGNHTDKRTRAHRDYDADKVDEEQKANHLRVDALLAKRRAKYLRSKYGITEGDYHRMNKEQEGKCAICGSELQLPQVDHCHATKRVRQLLCSGCNQGLGFFKDSPTRMERAAQYVRRWARDHVMNILAEKQLSLEVLND
jgi:hypothetical protein